MTYDGRKESLGRKVGAPSLNLKRKPVSDVPKVILSHLHETKIGTGSVKDIVIWGCGNFNQGDGLPVRKYEPAIDQLLPPFAQFWDNSSFQG